MRKKWKPFWSYDIRKMENWLHDMALAGYRLTKIRTNKRLFIFEEAQRPQRIHYHIVYDKSMDYHLSEAIQSEGWKEVCHQGNWYVLANEKPAEELRCYPVRDGIIKRNRNILYFYGGIFIYLLLTSLLFLVLSCITIFYFGGVLTFEEKPFWIATLIFGGILWLLAPFSTIRLYKTNKQFW
ncbi:MAG: DUF2812 domain-containing protein [Bacillota bacterium]